VIADLLERTARRASHADLALKTDETTTLQYTERGSACATTAAAQGLNLRVVCEGRVGFAGSTGDDAEDILGRAIESAGLGEFSVLQLPPPAALPAVITHVPRAAAAGLPELTACCDLVRDRLGAGAAQLGLLLERSIGSVRVANTEGVDASYDVSMVSLLVTAARVSDGRRVVIEARLSGSDLPVLQDLEHLVAMVRQRLAWTERSAALNAGRVRALFLPSALPTLLLALEQALAGSAAIHGTSPLASRRGTRVLSDLLSVTDDPLVDGRPGSRPIDDEGVVSRPVPLVRGGVLENLIFDLETAARLGASPTGHGRRATFGKPQPACTNLMVEPGEATWEDLLSAVGDGLVLERVWNQGPANMVGGTFALPAVLAWRVSGGEVVGLLPELTVAGNAHDLLNRVVAVGREALWVGSRSAPPLVVDGLSVF